MEVTGLPQPPPKRPRGLPIGPRMENGAFRSSGKKAGPRLANGHMRARGGMHGPRLPKGFRRVRRARSRVGKLKARAASGFSRGKSASFSGWLLRYLKKKLKSLGKTKKLTGIRNRGFTASGRGGKTGRAGYTGKRGRY